MMNAHSSRLGPAITTLFAAIMCAQASFAITPEEGKDAFIWQGFQGGPDHRGFIPTDVVVNNTPAKLVNWPMRIFTGHRTPDASQYAVHHRNSINASGQGYYIMDRLNQPTVAKDAVIITNRGYVTPFSVGHIDRYSLGYSIFDYLEVETNYLGTGSELFLDDKYCTMSQSQAVYENNIAYIASNYYQVKDSDLLCDPNVTVPVERFTHLRGLPIRPNKFNAGSEYLEIFNNPEHRLSIPAHFKDQFLSPTSFDGIVYSQGGGVTASRDHSGVYSISNSGTNSQPSVANNWQGLNADGYVRVAPNSYWSPATNGSKVFTFLNGSTDSDYRNDVPTLTEVDTKTAAVVTQTIDSFKFKSTQETRFNVFNMDTAPVLSDSNTLVVINNDHLVFFDVSAGTFRSAPVPINGKFYGQPVAAGNTIFALSRDTTVCQGHVSCIRAYSATSKAPIKLANGDSWVWTPPSTTEELLSPFLATNSHIFVSSDTDAGNAFTSFDTTYAVSTSKDITNAARKTPEMSYPLGGRLAFAFDTLYIAHSAPDETASLYTGLLLSRPVLADTDFASAQATITSAWNNHDADSNAFAQAVKTNKASVVVALQFGIDLTKVADLDIDLSILEPLGATEVEIDKPVTYKVEVTNRGSLTATNVVASAVIPGAVELLGNFTGPVACETIGAVLNCKLDGDTSSDVNTIASGDTLSFTFQIAPRVESDVKMTMSVDGSELNPDSAASNDDDNSATVSFTSTPAQPSSHDLAVGIALEGPTSVDIERPITYVVTVSNSGPDEAIDVLLSYALNDALVESLTNFDNNSCTTTNCQINRLASGASRSFRITTTARQAGQGGISVTVASSRDEATELTPANNIARYENINVSAVVAVQSAIVLPRANGGSALWLLTLTGFILRRRRIA